MNNFKKYAIVGIIVFIITSILSTVMIFIGREVLLISLLIIVPITKAVNQIIGFTVKYILYRKLQINFTSTGETPKYWLIEDDDDFGR